MEPSGIVNPSNSATNEKRNKKGFIRAFGIPAFAFYVALLLIFSTCIVINFFYFVDSDNKDDDFHLYILSIVWTMIAFTGSEMFFKIDSLQGKKISFTLCRHSFIRNI
jgi:hypothetical protein